MMVKRATLNDVRALTAMGLIREQDSYLPSADCTFYIPGLAAVSLRPMLWVHSLNVYPGAGTVAGIRAVRRLLDHTAGWAQHAAEAPGGLQPAGALFQTGIDNSTMRRILEDFGATLTDPVPHTTYHFNL